MADDQSQARVAVVIPAHDAAATLAETLDSLLAQTFSGWAAIVVDDGSSDATGEIATAYSKKDGRIQVRRETAGSASGARNAGIAASKAPWILFLDADDTLDPTMIEEMLSFADARPDTAAVHCGWRCVNEWGAVILESRCVFEGDLFPAMALGASFAIHACILRRSAVEAAGAFDPGLKTGEDYDFWARVARGGAKFAALERTLVTYRIRADQSWFDPERLMADSIVMLSRIYGADERVRAPISKHSAGAPASDFALACYQRCTYAAGLALARGEDPTRLLRYVRQAMRDRGATGRTELDPEHCVASFIGAFPFARQLPRAEWPRFWDGVAPTVSSFLSQLEKDSGSNGLEFGAMRAIERTMLGFGDWTGRQGRTVGVNVAADAPIEDIVAPGAHAAVLTVRYVGRDLGRLQLPVCDDLVPAAVISDAIAARFGWDILGRYFARALYPRLSSRPEEANQVVMRGELVLARVDARLGIEEPAYHDAIGWPLLLQEVWGRPEWPQDRFYAQGESCSGGGADDREVVIEIGAAAPRCEDLGDYARVAAQMGGAPATVVRAPTDHGRLNEDGIIGRITTALGFDLCRMAVREALVGQPCDERPLGERLEAARLARLPRSLLRQPADQSIRSGWGSAATAMGLQENTLLLGRWAGQMGTNTGLTRGVLPAAAGTMLDGNGAQPPRLARTAEALRAPGHILFDPEIIEMAETSTSSAEVALNPTDASGFRRHSFETHFANGLDPWGYTSDYEKLKYQQTMSQIPGVPRRLLELACAEGHLTVDLASRAGSVIAADISDTALERARRRCAGLSNVSFRRLDIIADDIEGSFDVILCCEVLYYFPDLETLRAVARKLAAALAPGGRLILTHANLVVDCPEEPGFDWSNPFGAKVAGQVFAATKGLTFEQELRTDLYRVQRFRRSNLLDRIVKRDLSPAKAIVADFAMPEPEVARRILWHGGSVSPAPAAAQCTERLPILMYHRVAREGSEALARYRVTPEAFEAQLRYLQEVGFSSATFAEWREARRSRRPLPGSRIMITFDDGYTDFAEYAWPLLRRYGFEATVFIPTRHVGGTARWDEGYGQAAPLMSWSEIRRLAQEGVRFGSHSASHRAMTGLENAEVAEEFLESRMALEEALGQPVSAFCYPYGLFNPQIGQLAQACGYTDAVSAGGGGSGPADESMALKRLEVDGRASLTDFILSLTR